MPTQETVSASTAHMIAVIAMQVIREDPGLLERLRETAKRAEVPFDADKLNEMVVEMAEAAVTIVGQRLLQHEGALAEFRVLLPQIGSDGEIRSAAAFAVGSFTTEFVHSDPERFAAFGEWMLTDHPSGARGREITRGSIEDADQMLTLMAHVAGKILEAKEHG